MITEKKMLRKAWKDGWKPNLYLKLRTCLNRSKKGGLVGSRVTEEQDQEWVDSSKLPASVYCWHNALPATQALSIRPLHIEATPSLSCLTWGGNGRRDEKRLPGGL